MTGGFFSGDHMWRDAHRKSDDCYKLYYITLGCIWIEADGQRFLLTQGQIYLINGYKIERYGCESEFEVHWFHFVPQSIDTNRALYTLPVVVEIPNLLLLSALRNEIYLDKYTIYDGDDIYSIQQQLKLHHHIQGVIIEVLRDYDWVANSQCREQQRIEPAVKYIEQNYTQNITLKELSELCNLSPNHFHRIFTRTLHITPINYTTQLRMNRALTLISQRLSIKEISYELGYCNNAHFSRSFKRYYGFPPGIMRSNELVNNEFARRILDNAIGD